MATVSQVQNFQASFSIVNARVVTPQGLVDPGAVRIEDGRIVDIQTNGNSFHGNDCINAQGRLLMPGFVDIHADALEMAVAPRPAAPFEPGLILPAYETELAGHGITTVYHCVGLADLGDIAKPLRTRAKALELVNAIQHFMPRSLLNSRVHLRYEITDTDSLSMVHELIATRQVDLISLMDHTPGYGVFQDIEAYRDYYRRSGLAVEKADAKYKRLQAHRAKVDEAALANLVRACHRHNLSAVSHDDHTAQKIEWAHGLGMTVAEFPVTLEALDTARAKGMQTVFGSPNLVRGKSHAGNLSVADLLATGRVDILCLDYAPVCLLPGLFKAARIQNAPIHRVAPLFSLNPARAVGIDQHTGSIEIGKSADLILVDDHPACLRVLATFVAGQAAFQTIGSPPRAVVHEAIPLN